MTSWSAMWPSLHRLQPVGGGHAYNCRQLYPLQIKQQLKVEQIGH